MQLFRHVLRLGVNQVTILHFPRVPFPTPQNPYHFKPYPTPNNPVQSLLKLTSIYTEKEQSYGR